MCSEDYPCDHDGLCSDAGMCLCLVDYIGVYCEYLRGTQAPLHYYEFLSIGYVLIKYFRGGGQHMFSNLPTHWLVLPHMILIHMEAIY